MHGLGPCMAGGVCVAGCLHGRWGMHGGGGHAWHSVHGRGHAWQEAGHAWRGVHGRGQGDAWHRGMCMAGGGGRAWHATPPPWQILRDTVTERAVASYWNAFLCLHLQRNKLEEYFTENSSQCLLI